MVSDMDVKEKTIKDVFDYLVDELPKGWIAKLDREYSSVEIFGPDEALIFIKATRKDKASVAGKWPKGRAGVCMDPYEWGVLKLNDEYPFTSLTLSKTPKSNVDNVLNYIINYKAVYTKCLSLSLLLD